MPYIGKSSDGFGIRERYRYSASGSQTAFTGSDLDSKTLQFDSGSLLDVYLNGVLLDTADYNTSTTNTITLTSGATASDEVMIVVYDIFSLSDAMPKTGGTFSGAVTHTGAFTSKGIDDNADATAITITSDEAVGIGKSLTPNNYSGYQSLTIGGSDATTGSVLDFEDSDGNIEAEISGTAGRLYLDADPNSATASGFIHLGVDGNQVLKLDDARNVTIANGNLVIGTSGKGIDFSANSNASGMTSELLDDYEEGSATVNMVSSGATFAFGGSDGSETTLYYVKVGRIVHYFMNWDSSSTVSGTTSNAIQIQNLPFSSSYGDTFSTWYHRGGPGAYDIMPTAYGTNMGFMATPTGGGMWIDMTAAQLSHVDQRLRISGTTIVD